MNMPRWRWPAVGRRSVTHRDRSRLEAGLREYYASALDEGWNPEAEGRIHTRVSRAIATHRLSARAAGRSFRVKRVTGSHVAAIVCAGAAVIAFGNMNGLGRETSHSYVPPTSAPLSGQPARTYSTTRLSLSGGWAFNKMARPV